MATSSDCQLEERYLRLHSLVLSSTRVLQAKFDDLFPPDQLKKWTPKDKDLKNAKLSAYQIKHVKANRDSSKFDISLLVSLLRNFCYKNDKTHPLWDELDNDKIVPSLQCEIAQIVRIRNLRNKVCDFTLLSYCNKHYDLVNMFKNIKNAIMVFTKVLMVFLQMSHAPAAEMNESDFNKHWIVVSNVSIFEHTTINIFKMVVHLRISVRNTDTFWWKIKPPCWNSIGKILLSSLESTIFAMQHLLFISIL